MISRPTASISAALSTLLVLQPLGLSAQQLHSSSRPLTPHRRMVEKYRIPGEGAPMATDQLVSLVRQKIKYVFVLYQENRSFDSYFGTFPGAEGLFTNPPAQTPGFVQKIVNTDGSFSTISPFRIGPAQYAADTDDIDHSHPRIVAKMDVQNGVPQMDQFAVTEEKKYSPNGNPSLKAKQFGELAMAYEDCDTVPLLWAYADKFTLFDHIFQEMTGPSTPGNLAIIGAQTGVTQWALHPNQAYTDNGASAPGVPVLNDNDPFWGSQNDPSIIKMPVNPGDFSNGKEYGTAINLTFATLPLTLQGGNLKAVTATDADPEGDLGDVQDDVNFITKLNQTQTPFGWYEEGYDREVTDPNAGPTDASGTHASYVTHHNGPQYFGYISNNPQMSSQLHGLGDFFNALSAKSLPASGGVFYVKGGFQNTFSLVPTDPDPKVRANFLGDDDHPGYSDAQISEVMIARAINAIAQSPYWSQSAIIVTWDDSEGDYDHVPPPVRAYGPDGSPITNGPRVPFLLISPYSRTHYVSTQPGSQSSVVKFIDTVFGLPPLALLPDEMLGRLIGQSLTGQTGLGPEDALTDGITDLLDGFSPARLLGNAPPLPPDYVVVPDPLLLALPQATGYGCADLGIVPTDRDLGIVNTVPADFNPRPSTNPSQP